MPTIALLKQQVDRIRVASLRFFREFRTKSDEIGAFPNQLSSLVVFHLIVIRDDAKHDRGRSAKTG
jgi:putative transposase